MRLLHLLPVVISLPLLMSCADNITAAPMARVPGLDVATVALTNGAPETALHIAQQTLVTDPNNVGALLLIAGAQAALGQNDQAAQSYNQVLAIAPDTNAAVLGLGRLKLATDPAAAAVLLLQLTNRDSHNIAALIDLGIARDMLGRHADAQVSYRQALALEPGRIATNINLGLSLALSGDPQQALSILRPVALGPNASPRMRQDLAVALVLAGDETEAARVLRSDMDQPEVVATLTSYQSLRLK